jgi:hypothetical protein
MKANRIIGVIALAFFLSLNACNKEDNPVNGEKPVAPDLPPAASMSFDLSAFNASGSQLAKHATIQSKNNFNNAAARIFVINTVVLVGITPPSVIFAQAISQQPTLESDGKFHWVFDAPYLLLHYHADLAGWVDLENLRVNWEMRVSTQQTNPALDNSLWYEGYANIENNQGQWTFYNPQKPNTLQKVALIDWSVNGPQDAHLSFSNIDEGNAGFGDVLTYTVLNNDRKIEFLDQSEGLTSTIYWDAMTSAGYLQVPNYNNGQPAYWDENHDDIEAPA